MWDLPDNPNFYGSVYSAERAETVAMKFESAGWRVRKAGWAEFEIVSDYAELISESSDPVLLHGLVADVLNNGPRICGVLSDNALEYKSEAYDGEDRLIKEWKNSAAGCRGRRRRRDR